MKVVPARLARWIPAFLPALAAVAAGAGYQDHPQELDAGDVAVIAHYSEQSVARLDEFDRALASGAAGKPFVITRLYQGTFFEQIYVHVRSRTPAGYHGVIASKPTGRVRFTPNAEIDVARPDVVDWCVVLPSGEERGNLTGKAVDALAAHSLVFIIAMKPAGGVFASFDVASVQNPRTRQEVADLAPAEARKRVVAEAARRWGRAKADDDQPRYQYILVSFPGWKIIGT